MCIPVDLKGIRELVLLFHIFVEQVRSGVFATKLYRIKKRIVDVYLRSMG